ncbi:MAG TPA: hypothetical protein VMP01_11100 [Pirellulaceae bacterium]|nr:hypothetical protein [Pirellulaceae bacterium]
MNESKIAATDRLRKEGRWDEASRFRDDVRKKLREEGLARNEASEKAWQSMLDKFPPNQEPANTRSLPRLEIDDESLKALAERTRDKRVNLDEDIIWAYLNLRNEKVCLETAPSMGALTMLDYAREFPDNFYRNVLTKVRDSKTSEPESGAEIPRKSIDELRALAVSLREELERELASREGEGMASVPTVGGRLTP